MYSFIFFLCSVFLCHYEQPDTHYNVHLLHAVGHGGQHEAVLVVEKIPHSYANGTIQQTNYSNYTGTYFLGLVNSGNANHLKYVFYGFENIGSERGETNATILETL